MRFFFFPVASVQLVFAQLVQLASRGDDLAGLVDTSAVVFRAFASEEHNISRAVADLPGTLRQTTDDARQGRELRRRAGPRAENLRPARARSTPPTRRSPFAQEATPILRDQIRPFVREARPVVRELRPAADELADGDAGPDADIHGAQPPVQHGRVQPQRPRGPGRGRPRGGLPVLARLAEPHGARCSPTRTPTARSARSTAGAPARCSSSSSTSEPELEFLAGAHRRSSTAPAGLRTTLMQKQAPSLARLLTMVVFALSCFGLLLFLWLSFGGPVPLKPRATASRSRSRRRRSSASRPTCGSPACRSARCARGARHARHNRTRGDDRARPRVRAAARGRAGDAAPEDAARRDLRRDDAGHARPRSCPRTAGWPTARSRTRSSSTRSSTRSTPTPARRSGPGSRSSRGRSTAAGATSTTRSASCPASPPTAPTCSPCSTRRSGALRRLVRNTGVDVRRADRERAAAAQPDHARPSVFDATARADDALAETFRIFPTFLDESKATMARLRDVLARHAAADPRPAAGRAATSGRRCATCARSRPTSSAFFRNLDPLITASKKGLPARARDAQRAPSRCSASCGRSSSSSTRSSQCLEAIQMQVGRLHLQRRRRRWPTRRRRRGGGVGHYLRQFGPNGTETAAI